MQLTACVMTRGPGAGAEDDDPRTAGNLHVLMLLGLRLWLSGGLFCCWSRAHACWALEVEFWKIER